MMTEPDFFESWRRLGTWLGDHSAELASAIGIGLLILLTLIALRGIGRRLLGGAQATGWRRVAEGILAKTYLFFLVALAAEIVSLQLDLPQRGVDIINIIFVVAAALQVAIWTRALIIGAIETRVGEGEEHRTLGTAMGLIRVLVTVAAFLIAIIVILDNLGVNVTGLVAGLGIGGIAIGLAAQGIFSDLFAALAIIFDRPFRKGDTINVGGGATGTIGTVEHIGLKTTRIRALDGELVAFGNAELLKNKIHNFAEQSRRRVVMRFGIVYQTPPETIARLPDELEAIVNGVELATFDRAHAFQFGASSIDFELIFFIETDDYAAFMTARQAIMIGMLRRFDALDVAFAYPTQTTFTAGPDGQMVMPWPPGLALK